MKKLFKVVLPLSVVIIAYFVYDNVRYSRLEKKLEEFKQNENYPKVITTFNDTLLVLAKTEMEGKLKKKLLSPGSVLFNSTYNKCVVLFAMEIEFHDGNWVQEYYCFGDLKEGNWVFYHRLYGMAGMKMTEKNAVEKELTQSLKTLQDDFNIITWNLKYNDYFPNHHEKGIIPNPND
jgi:hypothetical protein